MNDQGNAVAASEEKTAEVGVNVAEEAAPTTSTESNGDGHQAAEGEKADESSEPAVAAEPAVAPEAGA